MKSYQIPWLSAPILGMKMLEVKNLSVAYGKHQALMDVSLRVGKEEIVVILGANGAGKSSLLRAIGGISEGKVSGQIEMDGYQITELPPHEIVTHGIALVPEGRGIFGDLSVRDNLRLGAYTERAQEEETTNLERVFNLFPKLAERKNQIANTMSGGEQQMVAIGRSMMSNPAILLLDEPSLGLSPLLSKELFASLSRIRESGIGILLVEQNAKQSLAIADRGYLLENAKIVHEDRAEVLVSDPAVQKAYLGRGGASKHPFQIQNLLQNTLREGSPKVAPVIQKRLLWLHWHHWNPKQFERSPFHKTQLLPSRFHRHCLYLVR